MLCGHTLDGYTSADGTKGAGAAAAEHNDRSRSLPLQTLDGSRTRSRSKSAAAIIKRSLEGKESATRAARSGGQRCRPTNNKQGRRDDVVPARFSLNQLLDCLVFYAPPPPPSTAHHDSHTNDNCPADVVLLAPHHEPWHTLPLPPQSTDDDVPYCLHPGHLLGLSAYGLIIVPKWSEQKAGKRDARCGAHQNHVTLKPEPTNHERRAHGRPASCY